MNYHFAGVANRISPEDLWKNASLIATNIMTRAKGIDQSVPVLLSLWSDDLTVPADETASMESRLRNRTAALLSSVSDMVSNDHVLSAFARESAAAVLCRSQNGEYVHPTTEEISAQGRKWVPALCEARAA